MKARRWLQVGLVLLIASGCTQRGDWVGSTLVPVDATGRWFGQFSGSVAGGDVEMTLRQDRSESDWRRQAECPQRSDLERPHRGDRQRRPVQVQPA